MQDLVEQDPETPDVQLVVIVNRSRQQHFGGHVLKRSADCLPEFPCTYQRGPSEIADFGVKVCVEQDIFWFQIAVNYTFGVQVGRGPRDLEEDPERNGLGQAGNRMDVEEEAAVGGVLEQDVQVVAFEKVSDESDDVGVLEGPMELDLVLEVLDFAVGKEAQVDHLEGVEAVVDPAAHLHDPGERAFPEDAVRFHKFEALEGRQEIH